MATNNEPEKKTKPAKKKLKQTNPYKYHKRNSYLLVAGKYGSIIAPYVAIFIAKFDEYFELVENQYKLSIGCILAAMVAGIAIFKDVKGKAKREEKGGYTSTTYSDLLNVAGWGIAFIFAYLFSAILSDLVLILGSAFAGQVVGLGFDIAAKDQNTKAQEAKAIQVQGQSYKSGMEQFNESGQTLSVQLGAHETKEDKEPTE